MDARVLIIEDDPTQCELIGKLLERRKVKHECATSFEEGMICARRGGYDVIVLDLALPDSDPHTTADNINKFEPIPVIAMTGFTEDKLLLAKCVKHGADVVLKGESGPSIMQKILVAIEENSPSPEVETAIVENHKERERQAQEAHWLSSPKTIFSLAVAGIAHLITLGVFIWNQSAANALFRQQVQQNSEAISAYAPRLRVLEDKAERSTDERNYTSKRIDTLQMEFGKVRDDMNAGFVRTQEGQQKILQLMIESKRQ